MTNEKAAPPALEPAPVDPGELRRLERRATPGPWSLERQDLPSSEFCHQLVRGGYVIANIAETDYPDGEIARAGHDARLLAAARNALPALLDRLAAAERDRDRFALALDGSDARAAVAEEALRGLAEACDGMQRVPFSGFGSPEGYREMQAHEAALSRARALASPSPAEPPKGTT